MNDDEKRDATTRVMEAVDPLLQLSPGGFVTVSKPYQDGAATGGVVVLAVKCASKRQLAAMFSAMLDSDVTHFLGRLKLATEPDSRIFDDSGRECFWASHGAKA